MKYTVVIPAYNAASYIRESITSVTSQNYRDWELVIINDGSTDETRLICEAYCSNDKRIQLISKSNAGVSAARNDGILAATGEYLFFLDADDMLGENVMLNVSKKLDGLDYQPDIVFGEYDRFDEHTGVRRHYSFDYGSDLSEVKGKEIWNILFGREPVFVSPIMTQIYRTRFLLENKIFFDTSLAYAEDHDWRFLALQHSNRYYFTYFTFFTYYYRESNLLSATHVPMRYRRYSNQNKFCSKWFYKAKEDPQLACVREVILSRVAEIYMSYALHICLIQDKQELDKAWNLFRKNDRLMKHVRAGRYKSVLQVYRVFGITAMKLISWFYCKR